MGRRFTFRAGLGRRLTLAFGLMIGGFVALAILTNLHVQRRLIEERLAARVEVLGALVSEVTSSYLFDMQVADLEIVYEDIQRQPDIESIDFVSDAGLKLVSGSIGGEGSDFLLRIEDPLIDRAMRRHEPQRARDGDLERVAVPVQVGKEYLGTVRFSVARAGYDRSLQVVGRSTLLVGLVFVLVGVGLSAVLARRLVKPLERLSGMADRAARGDLDQTIELETNDEIADLARSFNTMLGAVRASLAEVHQVAYTDKLTGLPNRAWFQSHVERVLDASDRGRRTALLFLDLDRFKQLNDSHGHHVGDQLLVAVAGRIAECVRGPGGADIQRSVCRLGGDEFTVVLPDLATPDEAALLANRIVDALAAPFGLGAATYVASTSIGIALHPDHAASPEELLRNADIAMYQAKQAGRNSWRFYDAHMADLSLRRDALERELRLAIDEDQFEVHFQPQISVATGEVVGAEALVRWRHPREGLVFPDGFLLIAQEAGLMPAITRCVIRSALPTAKAWGFFRERPPRLAVNVSAADLDTEGFAAWVLAEMRRTGFDPALLELELTESASMLDCAVVHAEIRELRAAGIRFAVDDFGTGYSNIARLKQWSFEALKIDRSLLQEVNADNEAEILFTSILSMAHALRLEVVAEGVETEAQLAFLRKHRCELAQGYLFARPMPDAAFGEWLRRDAIAQVQRAVPAPRAAAG